MTLLLGAALWCALITAEPWLAQGGPAMRKIAALITLFFSPVCHQQAARCWTVGGHPMPVCARCAGIYWGFLVGLLMASWLRWRTSPPLPRIWLFIAAIPITVEFMLEKTGIWTGTLWLRSATGFLAGGVLPLVILPALGEGLQRFKTRR